jgi:hypothetical protein
MQDVELQNIWKEYDRKLEESKLLNLQSWVLNLKSFEMIQQYKAKSKLNKLVPIKIWVALLGIVWVAFLVFLIIHSVTVAKIFFIVSAGVVALVTLVAVIVYFNHVLIIRGIDNADAVVDVQKKIARLQSSTLQITRILFLQTPFHTIWFYNAHEVVNGHPGFWFISFPITILFTLGTIWLYRNINIKNKDKKWFKLLFGTPEWTYVIKAGEFIDEIDTFKKNT